METKGLSSEKHFLFLALGFLVFTAAGSSYVVRSHERQVAGIRTSIATSIENGEFQAKKRRLELVFKLMYESIRTVSLLPSVRSIEGGNRLSDEEDLVEGGRFTRDGLLTVQQVYNNLASNVAVSEVYAIVDGFDHTRGEVPFFMFDSLVVSAESAEGEQDEDEDSDTPEESEEDEYSHYPKQLDFFRDAYPRFEFRDLDSIPAVFSPVMRTCDNTQYPSLSSGDVHDADGILYSVPFYAESGSFRGIISAIFRTNILEAELLDVPFVIVTDDDAREAKRRGFEMPERPGTFVLSNESHDITIFDRRNPSLPAIVREHGTENGEAVLRARLDVTGDSDWTLAYHIEPATFEAALTGPRSVFRVQLAGILITGTLLIGFTLLSMHRRRVYRRRIERIALVVNEIAEGEADLTRRVDVENVRGEIAEVGRNVNHFLERTQRSFSAIRREADKLADASQGLSGVSEALTGNAAATSNQATSATTAAEKIRNSIAAAATASEQVSSASRAIAQNARQAADAARQAVESVKRTRNVVSRLGESSTEIGGVIRMINEIAEQTNLLALNATIEAARAGEAGKGFGVVASEVKGLAEATAQATKDITARIESIQQDTASTISTIEQSGAVIQEISGIAQAIACAVEEQVGSTNDIAVSVNGAADGSGRIAGAIAGVAEAAASTRAGAGSTLESASALARMATDLRQLVSEYKC